VPADAAALRGSTAARVEAIKVTVSALKERPLFGWGLTSAKQVSREFLDHTNFIDNAYLVILIEMGIVGFATFVALIVAVLRSCLPVRSWLAASQILALLSLMAFGAFAAVLAVTQGYALFWLTAGLALGGATAGAESRRPASVGAARSLRL
jgi:O-antigen ligase